MNPYLQKALTKYYARRRRVLAIFTWASAAACLVLPLGVLVLGPEEGFRHPGFVAFELMALVSLFIFVVALRAERPLLLDILRERPGDVRSVRRGQVTFRAKRGLIQIEKEVSTLFVEIADGRKLPIHFSGDLDEFNRLQKLIEKTIAA